MDVKVTHLTIISSLIVTMASIPNSTLRWTYAQPLQKQGVLRVLFSTKAWRRLSHSELANLQGFREHLFDRSMVPPSVFGGMVGNAMTIDVVMGVIRSLIDSVGLTL